MKSHTLLFTLIIVLFNLQGIAQPINDDCANATIATLSTSFTTYTMDFDGATSSGVSQSSCEPGNANPVDVWFRFTTTSTGKVQLTNSDSYTTGQWGYFALYSGSCNGLVELDCDQINSGSGNTERYISHFFNLNPNQNYYLRFWDNNNDFTGDRDFRLRAGAEVFNDICSQSETLIVQPSCTILPNEVQLGFATLSNEPLTTCNNFIQVNYDTADVWYDFIAPATGTVSLPYGNGNGIVLILYEGNCNSLTPVFCNQTSGQGYISGLNSGQNYYLRVLNNGYLSNGGILDFCVIETLPQTTNDDCDDAIPLVISNNCNNPITANFYEATEDVGNRIICGNTPNDQFGIWYSFPQQVQEHSI